MRTNQVNFHQNVFLFYCFTDNSDFIAKCPKNRMFTKIKLSIRPLEATEQVVVEDISNCSVEIIELHFENEGGEVEDVKLIEAEQSAIVTFKNHKGISFTLYLKDNL